MTLDTIAHLLVAGGLFTIAALLYGLCVRLDDMSAALDDAADLLRETVSTWTVDRALACDDAAAAEVTGSGGREPAP